MLVRTTQRWIDLATVLVATIVLYLSGGQVTPAFASDLGLSEADCRCCHGTNLANRHHLLVVTSGRECLSCHSLDWNPDTSAFDLATFRDCLYCHTGSLADRHHLLVDQVTYDCFSCHAIVWDPVALQYVADFNRMCQYSNPPEPTGTISGNVTDQLGTGLGWASVATSDGAFSTLTTSTGAYELPDIAPGSYSLTASMSGFANTSNDVVVLEGSDLSIDFSIYPLNLLTTFGVVDNNKNQAMAGTSVASITDLEQIILNSGHLTGTQSASVTDTLNLSVDKMPVSSLKAESCYDGIDNDKNTLTDCRDPACIGTGSCISPVAEICNDNIDNNRDGVVDCEDPLCSNALFCLTELCDDGIDNNLDGLIDCSDPLCTSTSRCLPPPIEICHDNVDNDNNGLIDCDDSKCFDLDSCVAPIADELCQNGIDDNNDGDIDCADIKCRSRAVCLKEICDNKIDDDADRRVDCEDTECRDTPACSTYTAGVSLNFNATASREIPPHKASSIHDKNTATRWLAQGDKKQWLKLDLGGTYPVDRVDIYWHNLYADHYNIKVSEDGYYWKTATVVNKSNGGLDSNIFKTRDARFILIECIKPSLNGYSINEVEIFRGTN